MVLGIWEVIQPNIRLFRIFKWKRDWWQVCGITKRQKLIHNILKQSIEDDEEPSTYQFLLLWRWAFAVAVPESQSALLPTEPSSVLHKRAQLGKASVPNASSLTEWQTNWTSRCRSKKSQQRWDDLVATGTAFKAKGSGQIHWWCKREAVMEHFSR